MTQTGASTYTIAPNVHGRFDERKTIFMRRFWDHEASFHGVEYRDRAAERIESGEPGYSRLDFARILASWTVHDCFGGAFSWSRLGQADPSMMQFDRLDEDPAVMTAEVKKTTKLFGASLVGICDVSERWIYSHNRSGDPVEVPVECNKAIVMAIEMDKEGIATSPEYASAVATGVGYSKMAFAIAELGSRIRLCKVFTDLPLVADQQKDFGLTAFCRTCNRCADACEADAISRDPEPSYEIACPSNNKGIKRWAVNADRCYEFWAQNTAACSNCIAACPFSKTSESSIGTC